MTVRLKISLEIPLDLVEVLESHFFEMENCPWALQQNKPTDPFCLIGYFKDRVQSTGYIQSLRMEFPQIPNDFQIESIEPKEWQDAYKSFVKPWSDRSLHWIPLWAKDTYEAPASAQLVYLDAGMAFGTGSHETTQLCASRLLDYVETLSEIPSNLQIVDAGCGSGVLALSAKALGFSSVRGFDNDPDAIKVCKENLDYNPHIKTTPFSIDDLNTGLPEGTIDFLMVNIQTDVLIPFSSQIIKSLRPNAVLVLSGILESELSLLQHHYENAFHEIIPNSSVTIDSRRKGEWSDLMVEIIACGANKM